MDHFYSKAVTLWFQICFYFSLIIIGVYLIACLIIYTGVYDGLPINGSLNAQHVIVVFLIMESLLVIGFLKHFPSAVKVYYKG